MIYIGDTEITAMHLGASEVLSIALGDTLVYEKSSAPTLLDFIEFNPSNGLPYFDTGIYQSDDLVVEVALSASSFNDTVPCFGGGCQDTGFGTEYKNAVRIFGQGTFYVDGRGRSVLSQPYFD